MNIKDFVKNALFEDIGRGDLFEKTVTPTPYTANIIAKEKGIFAGELYAKELLGLFAVKYEFFVKDGDTVEVGTRILTLSGSNVDVLKIERTLLNMLQHASGIATNASIFAKLGEKHGVMVLDTRKTRPSLRVFEKYAAKTGKITNHRMGLDDALMIKDTHLKSINDLAAYIKTARKNIPFTAKIEIECESIEAAKEAICLGADIIMCDNMRPSDIAAVVKFRDDKDKKVLIECSGNIDANNFADYAAAGVDAVSIGAIIHKAVWLDFSMKGI